MKLTLLQGTQLYVTDPTRPASVVWGYIPWGSSILPTVNLADTWNLASGYYVFFPASDRGGGWSTFVANLANQMDNGTNRRFGFFDLQGNGLNFLSVAGTGSEQSLTIGSVFAFRNLNLKVSPIESLVSVTFDDPSSTFRVAKLSAGGIDSAVWIINGGRKIYPLGSLKIPVSGQTPGTLMTELSLSLADQASLETGPMYFGPAAEGGGGVTALRYPTFLSGGTQQTIAVTSYGDPALPSDFTRTYFQLTDKELKTTFSSSIGRQVTLAPSTGSGNPDGLPSRFVFSDRPVSQPGDNAAYYLTPYGAFVVGMTGTGVAGELICAYSATETFSFSRGDILRFAPGNAAWCANTPAVSGGNAPVYLTKDATTSWLGLTSSTATQNTYYSQPQGSPIYESNGQTGGGNGAFLAYQLAFKKLPIWPAPSPAPAKATAPIPMPLVPMVPYGAVPTADTDVVAAYRRMESQGINPARRLQLKSLSKAASYALRSIGAPGADVGELVDNMTPLGLLGGFDQNDVWRNTKFALSGANKNRLLQFEDMQDALRSALTQNQVFLVVDQNTSGGANLFGFGPQDATVELADWFFDLQLQGQDPDGVPPILMLKLFRDKSIKDLVNDRSLWEDSTTFSSDPAQRQEQLQKIIEHAEDAVKADAESVYTNFVTVVNDPAFAGLIAVNTALALDELPAPIRALLGGMTKPDGSSNIAAFRAHHVGVMISDTGNQPTVTIDSSSIFALVDYNDASDSNVSSSAITRQPGAEKAVRSSVSVDYGFKVTYLRALFENNALASFSAEIDLTVNSLFSVGVNLGGGSGNVSKGDDNIIKIAGSYSNHDGAQTYSFVATKSYEFTYDNNTYLKKITFDKVQFSATEESGTPPGNGAGTTSTISSRFAIWGSMEFNKLEFLDMFSFEKLSFANLGIEMSYQLTVYGGGKPPETKDLRLKFSPGNLRFDFGSTKQRNDDNSMLALLPFKLKSFLYSEEGQSITELDYFGISLGSFGVTTDPTFNFALIFDLDLGSLGGLVGSLSAFKFSVLLGWQPPSGTTPNALVFGVQMPEADGKLELNIEGVLKISIQQFQLKYNSDTPNKLLVLALYHCYMEILGTRIPPGDLFFDFALFAPTKGDDKIGWIAAFSKDEKSDEDAGTVGVSMEGPLDATRQLASVADTGSNGGGGKLLTLDYLGVGQRVGPTEDYSNFDEFLEYVKGDFWKAVNSGKFGDVYKPDGGWMVVASLELLELIGLGFVFYDTTPFYSLKIYITKAQLKGLSFEITYTKVSDNVGLFFIDFSLPDQLRTFQAGAASITLPALKLSIYTNGDFKIDLGFPANNSWVGCFRVEAMAGPIPVTGSGGFYLAKLSSATDKVFQNQYDTILAAGFGARLGVGKNFTAGPFKAGVSLTFFGIIEGAIGYYAYNGQEDVVSWLTDPKALALTGQFGVIGELYGTLDFAIIKASVNVRIQASVGVELTLESGRGGDILLYVEASVSVSVSVSIDLGLFSISISFSFNASFRFEWRLLDSGSSETIANLAFRATFLALTVESWNPSYALQAGLSGQLAAWMTPELTSVWTDPTTTGVPWFAVSLTMEYLNDPTTVASPSNFKPFEALAAQIVAWSLNASIGLASWDAVVTKEQLDHLNQNPALLVGGLTYATLIEGLSKMFTLTIAGVPPANGTTPNADKETKYATIFPMPPFLGITTSGRGTEFSYVFAAKSAVSRQWVANDLQAYFAQLYTNIISDSGGNSLRAADDTTVPLIQSVFLDWFQALIRSTVNALLTQMQNDGTEAGKVQDIYLAAVKSGQIKGVAGQMSQFFRSGLRLPSTAGMELPAGPLEATNPLYALIWQEFPVGTFADGKQYVVTLNMDSSQAWVKADTTIAPQWTLLQSDVSPYQIVGTTVNMPGTPTPISVLQSGPQAFSLANPITWTPSGGAPTTLRPLSSSMCTVIKASAPLSVTLRSRQTDKSYDLDTNPVPSANVKWALSVGMLVRKVPIGGGMFLPDTYSLGAADLTSQNLMRDLLAALGTQPALVQAIDLLYQESTSSSGLVSSPTPKQLFVLRTNTTTQSVPPPTLRAMNLEEIHDTAVGANTSDPYGFLQILEQSSVTNQTGYFLTYQDAAGKGLPDSLFGNQTYAQVTFVFELSLPAAADVYSLPRYVNAVILANTVAGLLYYAETTNPDDRTSYVSLAAGSAGVELHRTEPGNVSIPDKLARLYSLISYRVPSSTGFIASNWSVPSGPQKEVDASQGQNWRLSLPLYNLATANQGVQDPNRYSSIGDSYSIETLVVDAFGNAFGNPQTAVKDQANLYFDDLIAIGNWTGIRPIFNFQAWSSPTDNTVCGALNIGPVTGVPQVGKLSVYLCPSKDALPKPGTPSADLTLALYRTIINQLTAPAVTLFVTTNLDSTHSDINLSSDQSAAVLAMLNSVVNYLSAQGNALVGATLTITVPGSSADLALVFALQVDFGIKRTDHLSPEVANYPNAFRVTSNVPPQPTSDNFSALATDFSTAFPAFSLATGPADAGDVSVGQSPLPESDTDAPADGQRKGLWAVAKKVTDLTLSNTIRYYLAPKPLDTKLRSGTVNMPNDLPLLGTLPSQRTFADVDLDAIARNAFAAIDLALGAENASSSFQVAPDAYKSIAYSREDIADRYSDNEVEWLLNDKNFTGDGSDLCQGKDQMAQQMRAALGSAYTVDTIVQTKVVFNQALPTNMGNRLQLFGQMQRPASTGNDPGNFGLGTARVDIPAGSGGQAATLSFLYSLTEQKAEDLSYVEFPLEWAVSHLQVFLEDRQIDYCTHDEKAPASIWLQLINSFAVSPQMGDTIIPLAFREYPTPPTMVVQTAQRDTDAGGGTLADQTRWIYTSTYQARLFAADEITLKLIYNTGGSGGSADLALARNAEVQTYTLFEALMRFQSGYQVLQPMMSPITPTTSPDVLSTFATLVSQLANNSDWVKNPNLRAATLGATGPAYTLEQDVVTDTATGTGDERLITITPDLLAVGSNQWVGQKCVTALDPTNMQPYPGEAETCSLPGVEVVTHKYTPVPPLTGNFVTHQIKVKGLTTLLYENGNSGVGTRRNASLYPKNTPAGEVFSNLDFIYQTPIVALTNPITPFVDNPSPIAIYPNVVSEKGLDLGDYIRQTLGSMMGLAVGDNALSTSTNGAAASTPQNRRLKIDARYGFPIGSPSGSGTDAIDFLPLVPIVLVRSFDLPVDNLAAALASWVGLSGDVGAGGIKPFAAVVANSLLEAGIPLGQPSSADAPPSGAILVLDVMLYSQLSTGQNQLPLLRLSDLRLDLLVVAAPKPPSVLPLT